MLEQKDQEVVDLIAKTALKDRAAFNHLYKRTSAKLFSAALRITKIEAWAEEATQDAFVNIWHNASEYHVGKGRPMTWLISIARYRALDILRKQNRHTMGRADEEVLYTLADEEPGPLMNTLMANVSAELTGCLEQLRNDQRDAIVLAFVDGYTHEQIVEKTGKPLGTIKSWIRRGLTSLKGCLES